MGRLMDLQHQHHGLTLSATHVHLDHDNCLETLILRGPADKVSALAHAILAERGVRDGAVHLVACPLVGSWVNEDCFRHEAVVASQRLSSSAARSRAHPLKPEAAIVSPPDLPSAMNAIFGKAVG